MLQGLTIWLGGGWQRSESHIEAWCESWEGRDYIRAITNDLPRLDEMRCPAGPDGLWTIGRWAEERRSKVDVALSEIRSQLDTVNVFNSGECIMLRGADLWLPDQLLKLIYAIDDVEDQNVVLGMQFDAPTEARREAVHQFRAKVVATWPGAIQDEFRDLKARCRRDVVAEFLDAVLEPSESVDPFDIVRRVREHDRSGAAWQELKETISRCVAIASGATPDSVGIRQTRARDWYQRHSDRRPPGRWQRALLTLASGIDGQETRGSGFTRGMTDEEEQARVYAVITALGPASGKEMP